MIYVNSSYFVSMFPYSLFLSVMNLWKNHDCVNSKLQYEHDIDKKIGFIQFCGVWWKKMSGMHKVHVFYGWILSMIFNSDSIHSFQQKVSWSAVLGWRNQTMGVTPRPWRQKHDTIPPVKPTQWMEQNHGMSIIIVVNSVLEPF